MTGETRHDWEHSTPSRETLRYSLTFRTLAAGFTPPYVWKAPQDAEAGTIPPPPLVDPARPSSRTSLVLADPGFGGRDPSFLSRALDEANPTSAVAGWKLLEPPGPVAFPDAMRRRRRGRPASPLPSLTL